MLTAKQDSFAQAVALEGMNYSDAYRTCYKTEKMSDKSVWDAASKLASHPEVSQRITELQKELVNVKIMTAQERLEWLTEVIQDSREKTENKLKAADIMNKMQGEYVTKIDGSLNVTKLEDLI